MFVKSFGALNMSQCPVPIREALEFLQPKPSPWPFVRVGGKKDGAYLVPDNLEGIVACFSPGVRNSKSFEDELLSNSGIRSHMMDRSSSPELFLTPLVDGAQSFQKKWLAPDTNEVSLSMKDWINLTEPNTSGDFLLQIDIEGAEWGILPRLPVEVLRRFRVIVIELHKLNDIFSSPTLFASKAEEVFRVLRENYTVIHAHPNNCCVKSESLFGSGMRIPRTLEITMVRSDSLEQALTCSTPLAPELPHPLDIIANVPSRPPIFLGRGWRSSTLNMRTVLRIVLLQVRFEVLWRWKNLIPRKAYKFYRNLLAHGVSKTQHR